MTDILALIDQFLRSTQLYAILGLIVVDLVLGVASALRQKRFEWTALGDFYFTNVLPYVLGYLVFYLVFKSIPGISAFLSEALTTASFGVIVANLLGSIVGNIKEMQIPTTI